MLLLMLVILVSVAYGYIAYGVALRCVMDFVVTVDIGSNSLGMIDIRLFVLVAQLGVVPVVANLKQAKEG